MRSYSRRAFIRDGAACLGTIWACSSPTDAAAPDGDQLASRPRSPKSPLAPGMHMLGIGESRAPGILPARDGQLYIPAGSTGSALPLLVLLHGASGSASDWFGSYAGRADAHAFAMLAVDSREFTWDLLDIGQFGADVRFIDRALAWTFERLSVDAQRIALVGFSDGASYALSLGLSNGDLFSRVIAYAPCISAPGRVRGKPQLYVAHGTSDQVLAIDSCSRRIVPALRAQEYTVEYREFAGGHEVPNDVSTTALNWLAGSWTVT